MNDNRGLWRGKRKDNGEWIEGHFTRLDDNSAAIIPHIYGYGEVEVGEDTLGECTGLLDKNGKLIFEGDIVKGRAYSSEWRGVIVWISVIAGFGVRYWPRETPTAWENSSILKQMTRGKKDEFAAEIVGNIHDNPELLKFAIGEDNGNAAQDALSPAT